MIEVKTPNGNEIAKFIVARISKRLTVFISSVDNPFANNLSEYIAKKMPKTKVIKPINV